MTDCFGYPDPGVIEADELGENVELVIGAARSEDEVLRVAAGADGLLVNMAPVTAKVLGQLPRQRALVRYAVGMDNVEPRRQLNEGSPPSTFPTIVWTRSPTMLSR